MIAKDKEWLELEKAWEAKLQARQAYYSKAHEEETEQQRTVLPARLEKATREINKSDVRAERQELLRRGVYRGR